MTVRSAESPGGLSMNSETPISHSSSCVVQVRPGPPGQFTAQVVGLPELSATAVTREEALDQLRGLLQEQAELGLARDHRATAGKPADEPVWLGQGTTPTFDEYLDEIRKFREESIAVRIWTLARVNAPIPL